jgi:hypothetical protein
MTARSELTRSNLRSVEPGKHGESIKHKGLKDFLKRCSCHGWWRELVIKQKIPSTNSHEATRNTETRFGLLRVSSWMGLGFRSAPHQKFIASTRYAGLGNEVA